MIHLRLHKNVAALSLLLAPWMAFAQSASGEPAEIRPTSMPTGYQSVFADYKKYSEPELGSWRAANEQVGMGGGHAGHQMGASPAMPAADDPHAMHNMTSPSTPGAKEATSAAKPNHGADHSSHK